MRLRVRFELQREVAIPVDHYEYLTGAIYGLIASSDRDFATFLHDEGYRLDGRAKRFKLFVFCGLRAEQRRSARVDSSGRLWLAPGIVNWLIASPIEPFLTHCATGLLAAGRVRIGAADLSICQVEALPCPDFSTGAARFTCLSPIVAAVARTGEGQTGTHYLRPTEGEAFSQAVANNLRRKHIALRGESPADGRFYMEFDRAYLERDRQCGAKKVRYKEIDVVGAYAPFDATGSPEMLRMMWECGAGEKNSGGCGMVEVAR